MIKKLAILCLSALMMPAVAFAQGTDNDLENDFGSRFSVNFDKKVSKGFHIVASGEARISDNMSDFGRYQFGLGASYKINNIFKVGAGYVLIEKKNSSDIWKARHRFLAYGQATLRSGDWRFSLRETLQYTHRNVNNKFQNTPNSLTLKSRVKAAYKVNNTLMPYGYVELRNVFNDPAFTATWSTASNAYFYDDPNHPFSFDGYSHAYLNRLRGGLGLVWNISKTHAIDFFVLADYCRDKNIDTNSSGTRLKSLTWDRDLNISLGVEYTINF